MDDTVYYVWLSLIFNSRCEHGMRVLRAFNGSSRDIFRADDREIADAAGDKGGIVYSRELDEAESIIEWAEKNGVGIITVGGAEYPEKLRSITDPPIVLYYKGRIPDFDSRLSVAVVGTRRMTEYGKHSAYTISYDLAKAGAIVVSGMALGVDGVAHRGALDASGQTAAILGSGIDVVYPREHDKLYAELISSAAVLSEFKPSTPPNGFHFPIRNRIISALCDCTLVIEADERSGALITAKTAVAQGRLSAALPGSVGEHGSRGTNMLIKEGAKPVTCAADLISEFKAEYLGTLDESRLTGGIYGRQSRSSYDKPIKTKVTLPGDTDSSAKPPRRMPTRPSIRKPETDEPPKESLPPKPRPVSITPSEKRVYDALPDDRAVNADYLSEAGISVSEILVALTMLEIKGLIEALPGALYKKL